MKKKSVSLITAVGVLVILSGAYVGVTAYVAKQDSAEAESEEEEKTEIVSIASADVKSIKFIIDKKEVTFEKEGESWVKSDEAEFPVDQDKIDTLVSSLNSVTAERTLEDVKDPSEYELNEPENTITVTTENGETTVIQLGMENESTSQEYIDLNNDSSTVYVVSNSTFSSFEGTLYDFAKSGTFPTVDSSTISKITVNGEKTSYSLEKDENNFWNITAKDDAEKADSAKATSLASAVSGIAYSSYVNYSCADDELSEYGLDKPYAEITVDYKEEVESSTEDENEAEKGSEDVLDGVSEASEDDAAEETDGAEKYVAEENSTVEDNGIVENAEEEGDTETEPEMVDCQLIIRIGDQSSDGGRYVRVNDSNEIYTISEDTIDTFLEKTNADFWDLTVSYLSVNNLEKLDVEYEGEEYNIDVSRETSEDATQSSDENTDADDAMTVNSSSSSSVTLSYTLNGNELESTTFTTFYNKLINMAAQKRLTEGFESNADPEMTVKLTSMDGNKIDVDYYSYDTNYYAAVSDGKVYLVNKMTVKELFQSFETVIGENDAIDNDSTETEPTEDE